jgi:hypothetical protein
LVVLLVSQHSKRRRGKLRPTAAVGRCVKMASQQVNHQAKHLSRLMLIVLLLLERGMVMTKKLKVWLVSIEVSNRRL